MCYTTNDSKWHKKQQKAPVPIVCVTSAAAAYVWNRRKNPKISPRRSVWMPMWWTTPCCCCCCCYHCLAAFQDQVTKSQVPHWKMIHGTWRIWETFQEYLKLIKRKNHLKISLLKIWNESIMDFFLWSKDIPRRSNSDRILVVHMDNPWDKLLDSSDRWTASGKRQGFGVWKLMTFPRCKLWMCHDVPIYILWIYIYT